MADWPSLPFDNLWKFVTFLGVALLAVVSPILLARLDAPTSTLVLRWAFGVAGLMAVGGGLMWYVRTQRHIDRRHRLASPNGTPAVHTGLSENESPRDPGQRVEVTDLAPSFEVELPTIPNPSVQCEMAIWSIRFVAQLHGAKPTLTFALLGINFGDGEVILDKVAVPYFYVSADRAVDLRDEITRNQMIRLPAGQPFQFFVRKALTAEHVRDFGTLARTSEYHASTTIEAHGRRGVAPITYAISNVDTPGTIDWRAEVALSNTDLALVALAHGDRGPSVQRAVEGGQFGTLKDALKNLSEGRAAPTPADLMQIFAILDRVWPGVAKAFEAGRRAAEAAPPLTLGDVRTEMRRQQG